LQHESRRRRRFPVRGRSLLQGHTGGTGPTAGSSPRASHSAQLIKPGGADFKPPAVQPLFLPEKTSVRTETGREFAILPPHICYYSIIMSSHSGNIFMVVAPSGAGKSSLVNALLANDQSVVLSISCTTRAPRPGEVADKHYRFVSH